MKTTGYKERHNSKGNEGGIPYLISWNFEHLVKVKTRKMVSSVNILKGFMEMEIISPQEL